MTAAPLITLRVAGTGYEAFLQQLFCAVHAAEFAPLGLPAEALHTLLDLQFKGQATTYAAHFPHASSLVVESQGRPVGRVLLDVQAEALHLVDLALLPDAQGQGIGGTVLEWVIGRAAGLGVPISLQVRCGSAAQRFYERHGFAESSGDAVNLRMVRAAATPLDPSESDFRALLGQTVQACGQDGTGVPLVVTAVQTFRSTASPPAERTGESFSVEFRGPHQPALASAGVRLLTANGYAMDVFLSPTGAGELGMEYEAVFHRQPAL